LGEEAPSAAAAPLAGLARLGLLRGLGVHLLRHLVPGGLQRLGLRVQLGRVLGLQAVAHVLDGRLDLRLRGLVHRVAHLQELLLGLVGRVLGAVPGLHQLALAAVVVGVRLRVLDHALDLFVSEAGAGLDLDLLLLARAEVLGAHVEDAVGVDVEADLDLRHAPRRRWNPVEGEGPENAVVPRHRPLALEHDDLH